MHSISAAEFQNFIWNVFGVIYKKKFQTISKPIRCIITKFGIGVRDILIFGILS